MMLLPAKPGSMVRGQAVTVNPAERAAIAQASETGPEQACDYADKSGSEQSIYRNFRWRHCNNHEDNLLKTIVNSGSETL